MTIQQVPSKGRASIMKIQNFTIHRRNSVTRILYGSLLFFVGMIMVITNPLDIATDYIMELREGSFVFRMWENPTYRLYSEVWIYNYTNVPEFLSGDDAVIKLKEIGPFKFEEKRTNQNMSINREKGVLSMYPDVKLTFLPNESIAHSNDVVITVPNIALIAISTLAADKLGYLGNAGAYYSISALGSKLFMNMTVNDFLWGYDDPLVSIASRLLPGWIDFGKIGIMDRFYAQKRIMAEVEIKDKETKYSLKTWDNSAGLVERGFKDLNTSTLCNRIVGSYEGIMVTPGIKKDKVLPIFRKQACRIYPFVFSKEIDGGYGFKYYRFEMDRSAFNKSSPYACKCTKHCLPDGFIDISSCFYGFPIALSKPHFMDADPRQMAHFEGMHPDQEKHVSRADLEPSLGVPLSVFTNMQVNIAVRTSRANPITEPVDQKVLPLLWLSLYCQEAPETIIDLLRLRLVIAPPLIVTVEVLLFLIGIMLGAQGSYRIWKPKYKIIQPLETEAETKPRKTSIVVNISDNRCFKDDNEDMAKEAVSLLSLREEDFEFSDLYIRDKIY